jgi:hypothetical protein
VLFGSPLAHSNIEVLCENAGISTAAILIAVLVLLVFGDLAVVWAWTHRKRRGKDPAERNESSE